MTMVNKFPSKNAVVSETTPTQSSDTEKQEQDVKIHKHGKYSKNKVNKKHEKKKLIDGKQPVQPVKLNRRMRKLERETLAKQLVPSTVTRVVQENFSCNWKLLQKVLDADKQKAKKRRHSISSNDDHKRRRLHSSNQESGDHTTAGAVPPSGLDATDALIESIKQQNLAEKKPVAWFDNVDPFLLEDDIVPASPHGGDNSGEDDDEDAVEVDMDHMDDFLEKAENRMQEESTEWKVSKKRNKVLGSAVAIDCEMVGVGPGGSDSALARVSIVDQHGEVLYNKFVKPMERVTDYRTQYSGIRPENLTNAPSYSQVQAEVARLVDGRLLVGHALSNDLNCLMLSHPHHNIRDTSSYQPFRAKYDNYSPSLKNLCKDVLGVVIQDGEHDSVIDARAAMRLYAMHRDEWERSLSEATNRGQVKKITNFGAKRKKGAPNGLKRRSKKKKIGGRFARNLGSHGKKK